MRTARTVLVSLLVGGLLAAWLWDAFDGNRDEALREQRQARHARTERKAEANYQALVAGCKRGNQLRRAQNHNSRRDKRYLNDAAEIRGLTAQSQAPSLERRLNLRAERRWSAWAGDVGFLQLRHCRDEYPRP